MLRILFYGFLIYLLYQLVFNFIVPVYRTTKQIKKGFRNMSDRMNHPEGQEQMNEQMKQQHSSNQASAHNASPDSKNSVGEYIDFEEVK